MRRTLTRSPWLMLIAGVLLGILLTRAWELRGPSGNQARALATLRDAFQITHNNYVEADKTDPTQLAYNAIKGMIEGLGDTGHSRFLTPDQRKQEQQSLSGNFVGIGVEVAERDGHTVVVAAFPDSPAARAGLQPGDRFLKVNGEDVSNLGISDLSSKLRGSAGSSVQVTILHPDNTVLETTLTREEIHLPFVQWAPIAGSSLWHIHISQFGDGASKQLGQALDAAKQAGATGIVLDLRDDPGGLLDEAVGVASRFIQDGTVLIEQDRGGAQTPVKVKSGVDATDLPVTLLINGGSASASEVVAAALLAHNRATAVGVQTFGTGTVLQTFPLPDGSALLLGVQEWLTPDGQPLWKHGVTPTTQVTLSQDVRPVIPPVPSSPPEEPCTGQDTQLLAAATAMGLTCPAKS